MPEPTMPPTPEQLKEEHSRFAYSFLPGTLFVLLLWLVFVLSRITGANLVWLGVFPQNFFGLIGVVTSPLIHSGLIHVLSNSFPLILLSGIILFMHRRVALRIFIFVYVGSGLMTWFIGRHAYHIGASGVVYGLAGYLLFQGLIRRDRASLAVSLAVLILYAGLFHGLFPSEERISWEGHLGGFFAGLVAALIYGEGKLKQPVKEVTPEEQDIRNLQEQHLSSTLQLPALQLPITYTVSMPESTQKYHHRYRLNTRTGMIEYQTYNNESSSNMPANQKRQYGRRAGSA